MCLFFVGNAFGQATFVSTQTGNWNSTSSWNLTSGSDSDDIPDSNDTVIILSNHTITVNTGSQACSQLTVGPTSSNISTLSFANGTTESPRCCCCCSKLRSSRLACCLAYVM